MSMSTSSEIVDRLQADIKDAMRARDTARTTALRMFANAIQVEAKAKLRDLSDDEVITVLQRERKRRIEAAESFDQGGAEERAAAERTEAGWLDSYLPEPLDADALAALVDEVVTSLGASSMRDMGPVMKELTARVAGRADGSTLSGAVRARLQG